MLNESKNRILENNKELIKIKNNCISCVSNIKSRGSLDEEIADLNNLYIDTDSLENWVGYDGDIHDIPIEIAGIFDFPKNLWNIIKEFFKKGAKTIWDSIVGLFNWIIQSAKDMFWYLQRTLKNISGRALIEISYVFQYTIESVNMIIGPLLLGISIAMLI
jgi:hypothetical protein